MTLHPQVREFLDVLAEQDGPGWEDLSPTEGREVFSSLTDLFGEGPEVATVEDHFVHDDLAVRVYSPAGGGPFPAIVYFHGGGWVLGDLDTHDTLCRRLTKEGECIVVSVGYRRSPETVFPGALNDCYQATQFVAQEAANWRVDPTRIIVAGDSAGGNLAAAVALKAIKDGGPQIFMQVLIYPVLDSRCESASYTEFAEGFGLSKASMQWFWEQYRGACFDGADEALSPSLATPLEGLPQAHVVTAEYDVLRDEGEEYSRRLKSAGVPTTHRRYNGMIHGFVHFSGLFDVGRVAISDIANMIRTACAMAKQAEQ